MAANPNDPVYLQLYESVMGKHGKEFCQQARQGFVDEVSRRRALAKWFLEAGPIATAVEEMARESRRSPENELLCNYAQLLKDPKYAVHKESVAARLSEVLLTKVFRTKKNRSKLPEPILDSLLHLSCISQHARRGLTEMMRAGEHWVVGQRERREASAAKMDTSEAEGYCDGQTDDGRGTRVLDR